MTAPATRLAVVGGGIAGAMLAWRLCRRARTAVDVYAWHPGPAADATGVSGGLVRGFETDAHEGALAAESLAEIRGDAVLAAAARYREGGSVYFLGPGTDPRDRVAEQEAVLPGSARVVDAAEAALGIGFGPRAVAGLAVVERHAGHICPDALRRHALDRSGERGARILRARVREVTAERAVVPAGGAPRRYDAVVVAAGPWSGALLPASARLRTRRIQYGLYRTRRPGLPCFVDDVSTLYGRPDGDAAVLLGVASSAWDVGPDGAAPDVADAGRIRDTARAVLADADDLPSPHRLVAGVDCHAGDGGLRLRPVAGAAGLFSFTGGAGGAAKTVVAASRAAAASLLQEATGAPPPTT